MRSTLTIARREIAAYFNSPVAYIVIVAFTAVSGYMFFTELFLSGQADMRPLFGLAPFLFCFFIPAVTMRLFAEEKQQGTLEMLLVFPVTDWQVVLGKFLAGLTLVATMIACTIPYAVFVKVYGPLDRGPAIGGYLGLLFAGGACVGLGIMTSIWTKNQIVSWILGMAFCFALFLVGKLLPVVPQSIAPFLQAISFDYHFQSIGRGVIDTRDLAYYASLTGISLVIAQASLDSRRWR